MKRLENFILDNRESFDTEVPDLRVWAALDKQLSDRPAVVAAPRVVSMWSRLPSLRMAASIALLVTSGIAMGSYFNSRAEPQSLAALSPEHAELERYYKQQIDNKQRQLVNVAYAKNDDVQDDLQEIDQVMAELREALTNAPRGSREQIIRNMIESYKNKMAILEHVINRTNRQSDNNFSNTNQTKFNSNNNDNNEKDTI